MTLLIHAQGCKSFFLSFSGYSLAPQVRSGLGSGFTSPPPPRLWVGVQPSSSPPTACPPPSQVLKDAVTSGAKLGAIFKEPTVTPSALQVGWGFGTWVALVLWSRGGAS